MLQSPVGLCWEYFLKDAGRSPVKSGKAPPYIKPNSRAWAYLRHSPGDNQTLDSQELAVEQFCRDSRVNLTRTFKDRSKSGTTSAGREAFNRMIYLARQEPRPADVLIVWDLSRFARSVNESQYFRADLRRRGWQVHSMNDDIPDGPASRLIEAVIDWKNEQFIEDLRANTIRGLRFLAERGCLPTGRVCKGYLIEKSPLGSVKANGKQRMGRKPAPDPDTAPLVAKAFELKAQGAPNRVIASKTGLYATGSGSWNNMFRNRAYIGEYEFNDDVYTNIYPPLISTELFSAVQDRLPKLRKGIPSRHHPRRKGSSFFLANIARCGYCGARMEGKRVGRYRYYICRERNRKAGRCPNSGLLRADDLEERILGLLVDHILCENYLGELLKWTEKHLNNDLDDIELSIERKRKEFEDARRLARKMARNFGTMETPSSSAAEVLAEQDDLVERLGSERDDLIEKHQDSQIHINEDEIAGYLSETRFLIARGEFYDLRELTEQLISRITLAKDECVIEVHFPM
jgi:site-specific DNA recombinase